MAASHAKLVWDQPVQEFHKAPADQQAEASFAFRNDGDTKVTIISVQTSCGCTTAAVDKKTYAPGEWGCLKAVYRFTGHVGVLHKTIAICTDDDPAHVTALEIRVVVNEPLKIKSSLVYWRIGDAKDPKFVELTAVGEPLRVTQVISSNPRLTAILQVVKEGQQYTIQITPVDTNQKESAQISVLAEVPGNSPRKYLVYAMIK